MNRRQISVWQPRPAGDWAKGGASAAHALSLMEDAAFRAGLEVKYVNLQDDEVTINSGSCVLKNHKLLLIDRRLGLEERGRVIAGELAGMNIDNLFLPPAAREIIDSARR